MGGPVLAQASSFAGPGTPLLGYTAGSNPEVLFAPRGKAGLSAVRSPNSTARIKTEGSPRRDVCSPKARAVRSSRQEPSAFTKTRFGDLSSRCRRRAHFLSRRNPKNPLSSPALFPGNMADERPSHVTSAVPVIQPILDAFALQPPTWQSSLVVTTSVFSLGYPALASGLSPPGIAAAYLLGLVVWRGFGYQGFITVCLYFVVGTAVTKVRMKQKEAEGIAEKKKGRRGPGSVVGSGFAAALCSLAAVWLGVTSASVGSAGMTYRLLQLAFVASFCTKLSDTTSSEIGKAYGKSTFLVTTFERVPRGTEGAVSLEGTIAGLAASVFLALLGLWSGQISGTGVLICVVASQVANYGESYVGATLQDKPGYEWMNNDVVNVLNICTGAGLALLAGSFTAL